MKKFNKMWVLYAFIFGVFVGFLVSNLIPLGDAKKTIELSKEQEMEYTKEYSNTKTMIFEYSKDISDTTISKEISVVSDFVDNIYRNKDVLYTINNQKTIANCSENKIFDNKENAKEFFYCLEKNNINLKKNFGYSADEFFEAIENIEHNELYGTGSGGGSVPCNQSMCNYLYQRYCGVNNCCCCACSIWGIINQIMGWFMFGR